MPLLGDLDVVMMWGNGLAATTRAGRRRERRRMKRSRIRRFVQGHIRLQFVETPQQPSNFLNILKSHDVMILDQ